MKMTIKISFELLDKDAFRAAVGITDGYLNDTQEDYDLFMKDFSQWGDSLVDIYEWLTSEFSDQEFTEALFELVDDKPIRLIKVDYQPEPEDATLCRDYRWVIDELNNLANRINCL